MQKFVRIVAAAAIIGLGVWAWFIFFPSPEKAIRSRLNTLAKTVSFEPKDGIVKRGYSAQRAAGFFATNAEVNLEVRGFQALNFNGRDEILQAMLMAAKAWRGLKVEFLDINITIEPDKQSAKANLTGKATAPGERNFDVQEFNFYFRKVDGDWLIYKVETVKTLSMIDRSLAISQPCLHDARSA
jgi:hypothetical protein